MMTRDELFDQVNSQTGIKYKELLGCTLSATDPRDIKKYYACYFLPSLRLFRVVLEKQKRNAWKTSIDIAEHYDALITIVGYAPVPVLHTICSLRPDKVYPVISGQIETYYCKNYSKNLKDCLNEWKSDDADSANVSVQNPAKVDSSVRSLDTYNEVKGLIDLIKRENRSAKIAIDVTGGKKSSVVVAFLAAALQPDIDIFYVDFEEYKDSRPLYGTEFLNKLDNPYEICNIELVVQADKLFGEANYYAAHQILSSVCNAMSGHKDSYVAEILQERQKAISKMRDLAEYYMHWDRFEYQEAFACANKNLLIKYGDVSPLVLNEPKSVSESQRLIYQENNQFDFVKGLCLDRYENAERRYRQGRYEDALTRYSQSLEMASKSFLIKKVVEENIQIFKQKINENGGEKKVEWEQYIEGWAKSEIDRAAISRVLNWILCISDLQWNPGCKYRIDKNKNNHVRDKFIIAIYRGENIDNMIIKNKISEELKPRNSFIHISSLSARKEHVDQFRDFVKIMMNVIYEAVEMDKYKFISGFIHEM